MVDRSPSRASPDAVNAFGRAFRGVHFLFEALEVANRHRTGLPPVKAHRGLAVGQAILQEGLVYGHVHGRLHVIVEDEPEFHVLTFPFLPPSGWRAPGPRAKSRTPGSRFPRGTPKGFPP